MLIFVVDFVNRRNLQYFHEHPADKRPNKSVGVKLDGFRNFFGGYDTHSVLSYELIDFYEKIKFYLDMICTISGVICFKRMSFSASIACIASGV